MKPINLNDVNLYIEKNIGNFHKKRIANIENFHLSEAIKREKPYLFRAKPILRTEKIIRKFIDSHIASYEEVIFNDFLKELALFVNGKVYSGEKSKLKGIDLQFNHNGTLYIISIKPETNWGNSNQIATMKANFATAQHTLKTNDANINIVCINGCCYGTDDDQDKGIYHKYCGQKFWQLISGSENIYTDIIEPLGHNIYKKNNDFMEAYSRRINLFTSEFGNMFCNEDGAINWEKLLELNSSQLPC